MSVETRETCAEVVKGFESPPLLVKRWHHDPNLFQSFDVHVMTRRARHCSENLVLENRRRHKLQKQEP